MEQGNDPVGSIGYAKIFLYKSTNFFSGLIEVLLEMQVKFIKLFIIKLTLTALMMCFQEGLDTFIKVKIPAATHMSVTH